MHLAKIDCTVRLKYIAPNRDANSKAVHELRIPWDAALGSWVSQEWVIIALSPRNLCLTDSKVNSCTHSVCLNNEFKLLALKEDCALSNLVLTNAAGNSWKCQSALNIGKHSIFLAFQGCCCSRLIISDWLFITLSRVFNLKEVKEDSNEWQNNLKYGKIKKIFLRERFWCKALKCIISCMISLEMHVRVK